ncbi:ATP-binding protein [Blastococcus deserti]|uniref:ATP-binding protein n=1 Tax=Blastococcus deserti TaxID=2259033 RepID=A0ABW4X7K5_9ACTN
MTSALSPGSTAPLLRVANRHVFGLELPWLPSVRGRDTDALTHLREAFGRQVAMLRALAESGQRRPGALQLRMVVHEETRSGRTSRVLRILLLGAANSREDAASLRARLLATLPPEFVVEDAAPELLHRLLDVDDEIPWAPTHLAEIRRAIESSDPEGDAGSSRPAFPVLLRWAWTRVNLVASLGALHRLPPGAQLIVHLEPRAASPDVLGWIRDEISRLWENYKDELGSNPLLAAVVTGYRQWLRDLPRACVHLRVLLACPGVPVPDGAPEVVGADLTRSWETGDPVGTFDIVRPATPGELTNARALLQLMQSQPVRPPEDPELAELLHLFDPHEASAAFRLPLPGPEGLPGLRTEPTSSLPRGLASAVTPDRACVVLGHGPSGDTVTLAHSEINRHLLVAGLPGYGKTTTVQSILRQLWPDDEDAPRVPFLVLDPAKTDYRALAAALGDQCRLVELGGDDVVFNPLACPTGVPRTVFATRVAAAFDAAYDLSRQYPAAASILARAVHYTLSEPQPTLPRLYATVRELITHSDYPASTKSELQGALMNRLELLTDGSLGSALLGDADAGIDWANLLSRPTVILAREFAGPRERALLLSLLLAGLVSHREHHPTPGLGHVTVVEEAHRILSAGGASGYVNDGAQVFADAMAELRAAGEGFIVVEQAPSRLIPEVRKLVGTVIAHRTVDAEERAVLAASLTLPESEQDLARLRPGSAIVLAADMLGPAVVTVDPGELKIAGTAPTTGRTLAAIPTAPLRLWCQECPVVCTGQRGASRVRDARLARPGLSWPDALRAAGHGLTPAESYCAQAFTYAQASDSQRQWARRRRALLAKHRTNRGGTHDDA